MLKLSLRDIRAHLGRYALTFLAVAIGVAFIGGILTMTDTITRTFDDLFADVNAGTDAQVRGVGQFEAGADMGGNEMRPRIDESLVGDVLDVDGVADAEAYVQGYARLIDKDGDPVGNPDFGAPTFGSSWGEVDDLNPFQLIGDGQAPTGPDEIVLDKASADTTGYEVGDTAKFQTQAGGGEATVVGIATFGTADSPFGASFVMFDLATAEELLAEPGRVDAIGVVADDGVSQPDIRDRVADQLDADGDEVEVITGEDLTKENQDDAAQSFSFFRTLLLAFAFISVVVGSFVIYTSFSFIVAQRQRQSALLRAVGAGRGQILWSVVAEALFIGIFASIVGYGLGVVLAMGLATRAVDDGATLALEPGSVAIGMVVGILVTLFSAFFPAWRASRVPPVAAMRNVAIDRSSRSVVRLILGLLVLALGVLNLISGLGGGGIAVAGTGVALIFGALVILGPIAARPAAAVLGWPIPRIKGIVGRLAQQNAARNPKRTSATGSALMIGLGIVTLVLVMNSSIRASIDDLVDERFQGDYVLDAGTGFAGPGLPTEVAAEINDLPEVDAAAGTRFGLAEIDGSTQGIGGIDPETGFDLFDVGVVAGNVEDLDEDGIAVFDEKAEDEGWKVGDTLDVKFAETGEKTFTIAALLETKDLTGTFVMSPAAFDANIPTSGDSQIWVRLADGVSLAQGKDALEPIVEQFPTAELQNLDEFKETTKEPFNFLLVLMGVLLTLTVIIAMIGIVNTLILSVAERTREIGLTRAVGATRRQIRSSIRWEALLIAAFGLLAALGVGIFFGWVLVQALEDEGFSSFVIPFGTLIFVTLVMGGLTLLAAVFPAWRAGRRPILTAITQD
jgi:putative ABC transport system permease protein